MTEQERNLLVFSISSGSTQFLTLLYTTTTSTLKYCSVGSRPNRVLGAYYGSGLVPNLRCGVKIHLIEQCRCRRVTINLALLLNMLTH